MRNLFWSATILMGVLIAACGDDDSGSSALCPPEMVRTRAGEGEACIDALEFSNEQYEVFLNENGNLCDEHECMHVDEPGSRISAEESDQDGGVGQQETWVVESGFENHPVVQVSFYGAVEACESLGKVLCGEDAWQAACAGPGGSVYPYGDVFDPDSCNGSNGEDGAPLEIGSMPLCEGGVAGLFDMSGNVYEWTIECADGPCVIRGGSFDKLEEDLTCSGFHEMDGPAGHREDLGFRCCK